MGNACEMVSSLLLNDVEEALSSADVYALSGIVEEQIIGITSDVEGSDNATGRYIEDKRLRRTSAANERR